MGKGISFYKSIADLPSVDEFPDAIVNDFKYQYLVCLDDCVNDKDKASYTKVKNYFTYVRKKGITLAYLTKGSYISLNVLGPSTLNTLTSNTITYTGDLTSNTITGTGALSSNTITSSGLVACSNGLSVTGSTLNYGTFASSGSVTCNNGFSVTAGTVSFVANSIALADVIGLSTRLTKLDNLTGSTAIFSTITSNTPTTNFSLFLTNVPSGILNAVYKLEI